MQLPALVEDYLDFLQKDRQASAKTLENYRRYLNRFLEFTGSIETLAVNLEIINQYRSYLKKVITPATQASLKKNSQNYFLIALRGLCKYAFCKKLFAFDRKAVRLNPIVKAEIKSLGDEAVFRLLQMPDLSTLAGLRDKAVLELLFSAGLKVSEIAALNRDWLDLTSGVVIIKGQRADRIVKLSENAKVWLGKYLQSREDSYQALFLSYQKRIDKVDILSQPRLSIRGYQRIVEKYVKKAKLNQKITPQTLRHSFTKQRLIEGKEITAVQMLLGHTNRLSTKNYLKTLQ